MADYGVNIKFNIVGESGLDRAKKKAEQLAKSVDSIRGIDIENPRNVGGKGGKKSRNQIKKYRQDMDSLVKKINETGEAFGKTHNAQNATAESLQEYVNGVKIGTQRHKDATQALKTQTKNLDLNNSQYLQNTKVQNQNTKATKENSKAKQQNAKYQKGNMGNIASSAIIGGAFPLLFGQTGAAAIGGATGGALGGLIGGQFGFALSIAGTAIGTFLDETDKLNVALAGLDFAFKSAGDSSGFTRDKLNELKNTLGLTRDEALAVAGAFTRFGEAGSSAAFLFGKNPNTMKNLAAVVNTKSALAAILDTSNNLTIQQQIQLLQQGKISSFAEFQAKINETIIEQNFKRLIQEAEQIKNYDRIKKIFAELSRVGYLIQTLGKVDLKEMFPDLFISAAERAQNRVAKIREELAKFKTDLPVLQELMKEFSLEMAEMSYSIPGAMDQVSAELRKLSSVGYMVTTVADSVGNAFGESFKGIVSGSMTAQQALANLFQRTADAFLDMAAQMIAKQIQMRILGIGLNIFGPGTAASGGGKTDVFAGFNRGATDPNTLTMSSFANGGRPPVGRPSLVGERGPELFVPNSAGTIIPNHAMGGSTSVVVNVDASGTSAEGDQANGEELGRLIGAAVQAELIKERRPGGLLG